MLRLPTLIVVFAFTIRILYALYSHDFWLDEAFNFFISQNEPKTIIYALSFDNWPPLYSLFMHYWQKISENYFWLRLPSVIFGSLLLIIIYQTSKKLFNVSIALAAILLASVSPALVYFSAENRPYSLFTLLTSLTVLLFLRLRDKESFINYLLFVISAILTIYTHYFGLLLILALIASSKFTSFLKLKFENIFSALAIIILASSPWWFYSYLKPHPECLCLPPLPAILATFGFFAIGGSGLINLKHFFQVQTPLFIKLFLGVFIAISTFLFFRGLKKLSNRKVLWLYLIIFSSILLILVLSLFFNIFSVRSLIFLIPIYLIVIAIALDKMGKFIYLNLRFRLLSIYFVTLLIILIITVQRPFFNLEPLKQMSDKLSQLDRPQTAIIHANIYTYLPAKYYYPTSRQSVLKPSLPEQLSHSLNIQILDQKVLKESSQIVLVYANDRYDKQSFDNLRTILVNIKHKSAKHSLGKINLEIFE
ncbi:glycosyltransferase family 39 protein [Candidatus Daviesbacteria bacterium]|nr:glycosyltransferase family 39 protein [Candidatus Daviesbacteria bacterium]